MISAILQKIGEKIFDDLFKQKIDEFEVRIRELEKEIAVMKKVCEDNTINIKETNKELSENIKLFAKMEGVVTALIHFRGQELKTLNKDNDNANI
jgi:hypothetical protein